MSTLYRILTSLEIQHTFYTDRKCRDFSFHLLPDTERLLARLRMRFGSEDRVSTSKTSILYKEVGGTPLITPPASYEFRIFLRLHNANFPVFSNTASPPSGFIHYFENQAGSSTLLPSLERLPLTFMMAEWSNMTLGAPAVATTVTATHASTGATRTAESYVEDGVRKARVKLEGMLPGKYILTDSGGTPSRSVYFDPSLYGQDAWAVIHLRHSPSVTLGPQYTLDFTAKSMNWTYFLVKRGSHTGFEYELRHDPPGGGTLVLQRVDYPPPAPPIPLPATPEESQKAAQLSASNGGAAVEIFRTSAPLEYKEAARSFIKLGRRPTVPSGASLTYLITHLPNPELGEPKPYVVVAVDPPNP